ncbi:MAG: polar amino acid transport system substrate-binding protein [Marinobacter excellens HL-55]|uniref:Polar amino acid transport system substrate-binding protein n=1 Tax=Marinobacter excellens HL-55 TaxID=1305731 RepID=A0A0P7ZG86_9GAMM|nr:MAG: polar amino acid transport system substrate-binding protein [Marinobacter excellens HL-55]
MTPSQYPASRFSHNRGAALLAGLCFALPLQAAEPSDTFRFNISPNGYPPYLIVDGEEPSGIMWDVVELIVPRMGYDLEPLKIPRKRVDSMLGEGFLDGTPRAIEWTEEPENFLFTDPVVHVEEVFFFSVDSDLDYQHPSDLFGKTVVTHLGYLYPQIGPYFEDDKIHRFDVPRDRDMFRFLLHGDRFDTALADRLVGRWILKTEGLSEQFRSSDKAISQYGFRIMLRPEWADFATSFNEELEVIRENGELEAILAKYR